MSCECLRKAPLPVLSYRPGLSKESLVLNNLLLLNVFIWFFLSLQPNVGFQKNSALYMKLFKWVITDTSCSVDKDDRKNTIFLAFTLQTRLNVQNSWPWVDYFSSQRVLLAIFFYSNSFNFMLTWLLGG